MTANGLELQPYHPVHRSGPDGLTRALGSQRDRANAGALEGIASIPGQVLSSGQLAQICGYTDTDGTQPGCWRYVVEAQDKKLPADDHGYR